MGWLDKLLRRAGETLARRMAGKVQEVAERELEKGRASDRMRAEREAQTKARRKELGIDPPDEDDP